MDVCIPVIKCRKQETGHRCLHQPVTDPVFNHIGSGIIAQTCLGKLYRADCTLDKLIHIIRSVKHLRTVCSLCRNVICTVDQDNIIILCIVKIGDHTVIKFLDLPIVF